jgi:PiT family inorganic phosphate transporter
MVTILFFLSSGLFLGWSLGANDAANVFGTAVGTKMIRFKVAAGICFVFVVIGAVTGGAGTTHTLGRLGAVNALAGSFVVALMAAVSVFMMTKYGLPVSTTQAIVGAIIGWNFFTSSVTDVNSLTKIVSTWVICPVLSAIFAFILYYIFKGLLKLFRVHLFRLDAYTRFGLLLVGAFGSYSLGANNIANVMGVFVPASPFKDIDFYGLFTLTSAQQLFLLGAIAIGVGVYTYSQKVMKTVGRDIFKLSPLAALVVVLAESLVLFIFASEGLESWLIDHNLPTIPLVPVSSSQAVIGAILGIGIARGVRNINTKILRNIGLGWIVTPVVAGIFCFVALFFMQNVFGQTVHRKIPYLISKPVLEKLEEKGVNTEKMEDLLNEKFHNAVKFKSTLEGKNYDRDAIQTIMAYAEVSFMSINLSKQQKVINYGWFTEEQLEAIKEIDGRSFVHKWQLREALQEESDAWKFKEEVRENRVFNKKLKEKYRTLYNIFRKDVNF